MELKAKVTAHGDYIIIEPLQFEKDESFIPVGNGQVGTTIINTAEFLGMSEEAVANLKRIKKSGDDIGDISTWKSGEKGCFAWIGGLYGLFDVTKVSGDNEGIIDIDHVTIPNDVPEEALKIVTERSG